MFNRSNLKVIGNRIYLRLLNQKDASFEYLQWLSDSEINKFLECKFYKFTIEKIKSYIKNTNDNKRNFLFGIFLKSNNEHIGNVKIGNIDPFHHFADIGILIGKKILWGKGYGTEAIELSTRFAFKKIKLNKLFAGINAKNKGSYKAFIKCGYRKAGLLKKHRYYNKAYVDEYIVERVNFK